MYKRLIVLVFALAIVCQAKAQELRTTSSATPSFAIKTNLLYDATTSMNLGVEFKVSRKMTMEIAGTYNPWTFADNKKIKHILVQPELRWWTCEPFSRHFFGLHAHYARFNVGGITLPKIGFNGVGDDNTKDFRYDGWLAGVGVSYGYQFYLGPRWSLETTLGVGYAYIDYDRFECPACGKHLDSNIRHYFGLTKAGISLIYLIK